MNIIIWSIKFLIPFVVLFTIGYYVPGFSALTIPWLIALSGLAVLGDWLANIFMGHDVNRWGRGVITFLVNSIVIFLATYGIEGGHVPLGASLLAALIITLLSNMVDPGRLKTGY